MATLTLKNVPPELYERLRASARRHRRSINSHAIACLERTLMSALIDPEEFLARVRDLRMTLPTLRVTDSDLRKARVKGRP